MRKLLFFSMALVVAFTGLAQTDSTNKHTSDTIKVGNFIIIKDKNTSKKSTDKDNSNHAINIIINKTNTPKKSNVQTNWWIFDLGFANYNDQTNYANLATNSYTPVINNSTSINQNSFNLNTGKSSNVNIWVFMQKMNLIKHVVNLKYGAGLEMYNFRYEKNISYRNNPEPFVFTDSIHFSKNKLYTSYLTVPLMLNFNATPNKKKGFNISAGVSAGYLLSSYNKQISSERGKQKYRGNLNLSPWRIAGIAELGLGPIRLYGSYSFNSLHDNKTQIEQYPYAVGIRFSNF